MSYEIDMGGKVAVVTGAAQGIGAAIAEKLTQAGAQTVILDVCQEEQVQALLDKTEKTGKRAGYRQCDISKEEKVKQVFEEIADTYGRVDVLVNNAGVVADWNTSYQVNALGTYYCSEAARPYLEKTKGNIVILTSASVFSGGTGIPQYVTTKAGSYALTRFLAREYARLGIRVNGIAPAVVMSKMLATRFGSEEAAREHYKSVMPLGRMGEPEDIASVALFLASDMASYLCGEVLIADGGRMHIG